MKTTIRYILLTAAAAVICNLAACSDDSEFSEDYDIPWIVSTITSVSPLEGAPGTTITIQGENMSADMVAADGVKMGTETCTILSQSATSIVVTVPGLIDTTPVEVSVTNLHNRTNVFNEKFVPVFN